MKHIHFWDIPFMEVFFFLRDFGKKQVIKTIHMQKRRFQADL